MKKVLLITLLVAGLLLFAVGCAKKVEETVEEQPAPQPTPAPEAAVEEATPEEVEAPVEAAPSEVELMSGLNCGNSTLSFTLNNNGDADWTLAGQKYLLNEVPDREAECGVDTLAPGESTVCELDSLYLPGKKNTVTFIGADGTRGSANIQCE